MASQKSSRRSRKRRNTGTVARAVPSQRREARAERGERPVGTYGERPVGTYGERPPSPFGGVPVSEIAIFAGIVGVVVGLIQGGGTALIVGVIACTLGVIEVTAREHFSGYRSHAALLAGLPTVGVEVAIVVLIGTPSSRPLLLLIVLPVYAVLFWPLRKRFQAARQARVARRPAP